MSEEEKAEAISEAAAAVVRFSSFARRLGDRDDVCDRTAALGLLPELGDHSARHESLEAEDVFLPPNRRSRGHALRRIRPHSAASRGILPSSDSRGAVEQLHNAALPPRGWRLLHVGSRGQPPRSPRRRAARRSPTPSSRRCSGCPRRAARGSARATLSRRTLPGGCGAGDELSPPSFRVGAIRWRSSWRRGQRRAAPSPSRSRRRRVGCLACPRHVHDTSMACPAGARGRANADCGAGRALRAGAAGARAAAPALLSAGATSQWVAAGEVVIHSLRRQVEAASAILQAAAVKASPPFRAALAAAADRIMATGGALGRLKRLLPQEPPLDH